MLAIQEFEREIKRGLSKSLYFIFSSEPFFLSEAIKLLRENFESLSIETYETPEDVLKETELSASSLFSLRRILLVHNFERVKKTDKRVELLDKFLKGASTTVTVILLANGSSKDFSEEISFLKKFKESSILNLDIGEREILSWINFKAERAGISLKPDAANYMLSITGGQPGLIASEIEKLALLCPGATLRLFDIKELLTELGEFDAFDLVDAIKRRDKNRAFQLLEKLKNTEIDMILGALNYYYGNLSDADENIFRTLYKANLSLRQGKLCSLELLVFDLLRDRN